MHKYIFDNQILRLTDDFYKDYPNPPYVEILKKSDRPYNCLLIQSNYEYFICVPYRTEISHSYAYKFTLSKRSISHKSGLDYTKIIIISGDKSNYIDSQTAIVDKDEYKETILNIQRIVNDAKEFVDDYVKHCKGMSVLHPAEFSRRYRFSPLQYFHKELEIE